MNKVETIKVNLKAGELHEIDSLDAQLKSLISNYNNDGYKVISITPLTSGEYEMGDIDAGGFGFGYTSGLIVVFEKVNS